MNPRMLTLASAAALFCFSSMVLAQADTPTINTGTQIFSGFAGAQWFDVADQIDAIGDDLETELDLGLPISTISLPTWGWKETSSSVPRSTSSWVPRTPE